MAVVLAIGLVILFFQGLLRAVLPGVVVPNLMILLVAFLGLHQNGCLGALLSFGVGLELDLSSGLLLGPWAASFVVVYGVLASLAGRIFIEHRVAAAVSVFCSSIVANAIYLLLISQFRRGVSGIGASMLLDAGFTAAVSPFAFWFLRRLTGMK